MFCLCTVLLDRIMVRLETIFPRAHSHYEMVLAMSKDIRILLQHAITNLIQFAELYYLYPFTQMFV